jgi:hypothetical protein
LKNKLYHVCLLGNAFQQTKNEQNRNFERDRLMLDISGPSLLSAAKSLSIDQPYADINTELEHDMKIAAIQCFLVAILELLLWFPWCLPLQFLFDRGRRN